MERGEFMFKDLTIKQFFQDLAGKEPAPRGGAASASVALHGISLAQMVIHFTMGTTKNENSEETLLLHKKRLEELSTEMMMMVDVENRSFTPVLKAMNLPKNTEEEKEIRNEAMVQALAIACDSPKAIMLLAKETLDILDVIVDIGNPFLVSDTLAGIRFVQSAVETASYNIIVNTKMMKKEALAKEYLSFVDELLNETNEKASLARRKGMAKLLRGKA